MLTCGKVQCLASPIPTFDIKQATLVYTPRSPCSCVLNHCTIIAKSHGLEINTQPWPTANLQHATEGFQSPSLGNRPIHDSIQHPCIASRPSARQNGYPCCTLGYSGATGAFLNWSKGSKRAIKSDVTSGEGPIPPSRIQDQRASSSYASPSLPAFTLNRSASSRSPCLRT